MQLKASRTRPSGKGQVGASLAAATCALLGTAASKPVLAQEIGHWSFDTAGLYYGEGNGRVHDYSVDVLAKSQVEEDKYLTMNFTFDTLSGASPNGAAPSASPQVFVRPVTLTRTSGGTIIRGGGNLLVAPGELPVDSSFKDMRVAGSVDWQRPLGRLTQLTYGGGASVEHDYTHFGFDAHVARDFNERNTTLTAGLAWSDDTVKPIGGSPTPFSPVISAEAAQYYGIDTSGGGSHPKHVFDALLGVTQVLGPRMIAQVNYSVDNADGYLTDPYKFISVVDPLTGGLLPGPDAGSGLYLYENRPSSRQKRALFGLIKRDIAGDVVDLSYRRMTDDWGIKSSTAEMHVRFNFSDGKYLQPHLRYYSQNAADFYHTVLLASGSLPTYASADYRLAAFDATTVGIEFGSKTSAGEFMSRLEVYRQTGSPDPASRVGSLAGVNLYPGLKAVILQIGYKFGL